MKKGERSGLLKVVFSFLRSALILILLIVAAGGVLLLFDRPMLYTRAASFLVLILSGAVAGFINTRLEGRVIAPSIIGAAGVILLLAVLSLIFGDMGVHNILGYLSHIAAAVLFSILAVREKRRRRR